MEEFSKKFSQNVYSWLFSSLYLYHFESINSLKILHSIVNHLPLISRDWYRLTILYEFSKLAPFVFCEICFVFVDLLDRGSKSPATCNLPVEPSKSESITTILRNLCHNSFPATHTASTHNHDAMPNLQ